MKRGRKPTFAERAYAKHRGILTREQAVVVERALARQRKYTLKQPATCDVCGQPGMHAGVRFCLRALGGRVAVLERLVADLAAGPHQEP